MAAGKTYSGMAVLPRLKNTVKISVLELGFSRENGCVRCHCSRLTEVNTLLSTNELMIESEDAFYGGEVNIFLLLRHVRWRREEPCATPVAGNLGFFSHVLPES
jgi:hypothetical protein